MREVAANELLLNKSRFDQIFLVFSFTFIFFFEIFQREACFSIFTHHWTGNPHKNVSYAFQLYILFE